MSRGLAAALALSVLVHGGAVAAIVVVGVAWLREPRSLVEPALYVDAVDPIVATEERRAPAVASRPGAEAPHGPDGPALRRVLPAPPPPADAPAPAPARLTAPPAPAEAAAVAVPPAPPVVPPAPRVEEPRGEPPAAVAAVTAPSSPPAPAAPPPGPSAVRPATASTVAALAAHESVASDAAATTRRAPAPPSSAPAAPPASSADEGKTAASAPAVSSPVMSGPVVTGPAATGPAVSGAAPSHGSASGASGEAPRAARPGAAAGSAAATQAGTGSNNVARLPPAESGGGEGTGGGIPPEYEAYVRALRQRVQERLAYPWMAVRRGQEGVVELEVRVGADGRLAGVEVVAGVPVDSLRSAAVTAVRGASPFPFPADLAARPLVIRLPVEFRLR